MLEQGASRARFPGTSMFDKQSVATQGRFVIASVLALAWTVFSVWVSRPWLADLGALSHPLLALFALTFIAYVPGFMNMFLLGSLVLEPRRKRTPQALYPGVSILIAAYHEEDAIAATLRSVRKLDYSGLVEVLVLDDGSTDGTSAAVEYAKATLFEAAPNLELRLLRFVENRGKARVLNSGLEQARYDLIVTIDADTQLEPNSLTAIVERLLSDSADTVAVAGAVLVANAHDTLITGAQE